jgi:hypothetical protein
MRGGDIQQECAAAPQIERDGLRRFLGEPTPDRPMTETEEAARAVLEANALLFQESGLTRSI